MLDRTGLDLFVPEAEVLAEVVGQRDQEPREELELAQDRRAVERVRGPPEEELKTDLPRCLEEVLEEEAR